MRDQIELPSLTRRGAVKCLLGIPPLLHLASAGAMGTHPEASDSAGTLPVVRPQLFLYDPADALALDMARAALSAGARTLAVAGDVTPIWQGHLRAFWRTRGAVLAGATGTDVLFCLDMLARDAGQRLRYHAPCGEARLETLWSSETRLRSPVHAPLARNNGAEVYAWLIAQ